MPHVKEGNMQSSLNSSPLQNPKSPKRARPRRRKARQPSDAAGAMAPRRSSPKGRQSPARSGIAGYVPFEMDARVDESCMEEAQRLAGKERELRHNLRQEQFREACFRKGIDPQQLLPKTLADFKTVDMTKGEARSRFRDFEESRVQLLGIALAEEMASARIEAEAEEQLAKREEMLTTLLDSRLTREKDNIRKMNSCRKKYEDVVVDENRRIRKERDASMKRQEEFEERQAQIAAMKKRAKQEMHAKAQAKENKARRTNEKKKQMEEQWRDIQMKRIEDRQSKVKEFMQTKSRNSAHNQARDADLSATRGERKAQAQQADLERRRAIQEKMGGRAKHIEELKRRKEKERSDQRIARNLKMQKKMDNAARMRKAMDYKKERRAKLLADEHARMERLKDINKVIEEQRRAMLREENIRRDQWKAAVKLERGITPGPGAYNPHKGMMTSGGTWGRTIYKTEFEEIERKAGLTPGPGQYGPMPSTLDPSGGCMATRVDTELDHALRRAESMPGPGAYKPRRIEANNNQSFSKFSTPGMVDTHLRNTKGVPGPGQYQTTFIPKKKAALQLQKATRNIVTVALMLKKLGVAGQEPGAIPGRRTQQRPATSHT